MPTSAGSPSTRVRPLDRNGAVAVAACILLLFGIGAASVWQAGHNDAVLAKARTVRGERNRVAAVQLAVQEAEAAQRGYLLTLQDEHLPPLTHAHAALPALLDRLSADHPRDDRVVILRQVITAKLAEFMQTVDLARSGNPAAALRIVRTNASSINMMLMRKNVAALEAELDGTLLAQVASVTRGSHLLVMIDVAGLVMVLALAGLALFGLRRYLSGLQQARTQSAVAYDALEASNDRLDQAVRDRTAELTAANEEIQRFAYIVSHDLRAPLVNIVGFTAELEQATGVLSRHIASEGMPAALRELTDEDIPEALRFIKTSTSKMDRLINAILRLSREGRRNLAPERLDLPSMLRTVVDSMQQQLSAKDGRVEIGDLPTIEADRLAVEQVFSNVVENAVKYLKPGRPGEVRITGRVESGLACFDVSDNGRGIAARDYERVFELFRRAGDQSVPGEGIGLAHVRALVRRLGGRIDCHSTLDVGTTFTISLPLVGQRVKETAG